MVLSKISRAVQCGTSDTRAAEGACSLSFPQSCGREVGGLPGVSGSKVLGAGVAHLPRRASVFQGSVRLKRSSLSAPFRACLATLQSEAAPHLSTCPPVLWSKPIGLWVFGFFVYFCSQSLIRILLQLGGALAEGQRWGLMNSHLT